MKVLSGWRKSKGLFPDSVLSKSAEIASFVIPAKRAFLFNSDPSALPKVFFFVIPAKRAGGPRELESMA